MARGAPTSSANDEMPAAAELCRWVEDARRRTVQLVDDLSDDELMGRRLEIVNPLLWEIGHVAWFQEKWVLRTVLGRDPAREDADALYDSIAIAHDTRWDLPLPSREGTYGYLETVRDRVVEALEKDSGADALRYHVMYTVLHEDMHGEAFLYTRQTHGLPAPDLGAAPESAPEQGALPGDVEISPPDPFLLGAAREEPFVFDNEKWAHPVPLAPFAIARAPVTQGEMLAFVEDDGYRRRDLWSDEGWRWREGAAAEAPVYWRREAGEWLRRDFDRWVAVEPHRPMLHASWFEAEAYCRWAGRRLPTEAEWEAAATLAGEGDKRRFPWGGERPEAGHANLDARHLGCVDVAAHPDGDSSAGCRQMMGNVWEWTADTFLPYPAFSPDPYAEYSEPWFGTRKVLRGGAWPTRARMLRATYRNFYTPDRRDVWAGFRTCSAGR